jgi:hypothetical protein
MKCLKQEGKLMSEIRIQIPRALGLSREEINELSRRFESELIGVIGGSGAQQTPASETAVRARPQVVRKEVGQVVEVQ